MPLSENELLLVESIKSMLKDDAQLGLAAHEKDKYSQQFNAERGLEYLHGQIQDMFAVKAAELVHNNGVRQAFHKVHSYKYLDDPTFATAMKKEMVAQGIPAEERAKALMFIPSIIKELQSEQKEWAEKDAGFNPPLDEVMDISQIEQPLDFSIIDRDGFNDGNINSKIGETKPGRTPDDSVNKLT